MPAALRRLLAVLAAVVLLAGCGGPTRPAATAAAAAPLWLCRPGDPLDPCVGNLATEVVPAAGPVGEVKGHSAAASPFDCFYVYPTVTSGPGLNAPLSVGVAEIDAAIDQAQRFSALCRVWAPVYRQRTVASLRDGFGRDRAARAVAFDSLLTAFDWYLAHENHGRPIIFLGHSQGAAMLVQMLRKVVDPNPALRSRMVSALLVGGNVTVATGRTTGGAFSHLPLCTEPGQTGCVIAYSTFPGTPPPGAVFGRPGQGVGLMWGQRRHRGVQVACTNPAALGGGSAALQPYFPLADRKGRPAGWVTYPGLYRAHCVHADGATWLQVSVQAGGRPRPLVTEGLGPEWGYHGWDVNLAMGNLLADVAAQEQAWLTSGRVVH